MKHVDLRFYAGLRDFLATDRRSGVVSRTFDVPGNVKDTIEACGVPHTEVSLILVNGVPVDFAHRLRDGDQISVYPPFVSIEIDPQHLVSPPPLADPRFVIDGHLGRLARYLRLVGFDCVYDPEWSDQEIVDIAVDQQRIALTRDIGLLMHGKLEHGYYVRSIHPGAQLDEVGRRFDLRRRAAPFTRCMVCNGVLEDVAGNEVAAQLRPGTLRSFRDFQRCPVCRRVYWAGAHHPHLRAIVEAFTASVAPGVEELR